jgi:3-hydroxyacyl-CoA dehydrogenase
VRLWRLPTTWMPGSASCPSSRRCMPSATRWSTACSRPWPAPSATLDGLVIWHEAPFAVGANLQQIGEACAAGRFDQLEQVVAKFQQRIDDPEVRAGAGGRRGAGHGARRRLRIRHACREAGAGAGKLHGPGRSRRRRDSGRRRLQGVRAARRGWAAQSPTPAEVFNFLQSGVPDDFAWARYRRARWRRRTGLSPGRRIPSSSTPRNCSGWRSAKRATWPTAGYAPPLRARGIPVAGRTGIAVRCEMMLVNMKEGGMISAHDYRVARAAAVALCGGEIEAGSLVTRIGCWPSSAPEFVDLLKNPRNPGPHRAHAGYRQAAAQLIRPGEKP